ncbi:hypothetical protein SAMN05444007_107209 [Cribrihabitans marinus]|uniref:Uncharacterized protein n=1 Tax=Cribrihabitans marinus TaxID=1227549 RepID=A0A1H7BVQ5_9RHOB|nr:DUF6638 family protein [Cribrihabitans marinus]GGH33505.1 hypothetical protein GCM10010973_25650 [Cribrihabitans marinus]SEJ81498.1 hypothetical protein SAMN05444007_107209 [Cribrihabitans marinus]
MRRLIEKGLMFGNLIHVAAPALVERYNRALMHLTGKATALTDFHVDISGYSPEVGDELGDHLYLNPNGVNRQFILLTTEQKRAPLLNVKFSSSRSILRQFIEENEAQLFALTATDAVAGELVNSVLHVASPRQLFDIRRIRVEADTTKGTLEKADKLAGLVERFKTEDDAWFDDVLIAEMIGIASETGDVTRNPVRLKHTEFEQRNVWTAHFGGLYLFPDLDHPAVIAAGGRPEADLPVPYVFDLGQRRQIAKFFELNALVEPVVRARGPQAAGILQQKMDFIVLDTACDAGLDLSDLDRLDMRRLARTHAARLPAEYHGLADLRRWALGEGGWPRISSDDPAYFYTLRAAPGPDRDVVNMALAELTPLDARQLFICHKELFYRTYAGWPEAKRAYVADFLAREYQVDKAGARAELYGSEPDMSGEPPREDDLIDRVGPWGAVRRR